jgi:putative chitinase
VDLIADPEQANEPRTAAKLLAAFLKRAELRIKQALAVGDFADARRAVNGGTFGLDQFTKSYQTGERLLG